MIESIKNRRSIRKYLKRQIEDNLLNEILEVAFRGPTTGNMQLYSVIVTKDEERKKKLWEIHFKQNMILEAPVVLTFLADFNRFNLWCKSRGVEPVYDNFLSFITAAIDAIIVAQNVCVIAESKGLGTCYLGTAIYQADKLIEFFECPEGIVPIASIVIGYPAEMPEQPDRLPYEKLIHNETYRQYTWDDIDKIYEYKENMELTKRLLEENKMDNLPRIFVEKRYTKKDNEHFSKILLDVIKRQKFL